VSLLDLLRRPPAMHAEDERHGRPTEMYNYQAEFMAYLDEVKGMNSEEMSNGMMKAEFRSFVEDFNTATMVRLPVSEAHTISRKRAILTRLAPRTQPHEKFYGMARFERSEAQRKKKEGEKLLRKQMKAAAREVQCTEGRVSYRIAQAPPDSCPTVSYQ
jgi:hypothetical protein